MKGDVRQLRFYPLVWGYPFVMVRLSLYPFIERSGPALN